MSVYDDMARDAGFTGDVAAQVAHTLEEQHRDSLEVCSTCLGEGIIDIGEINGMPGRDQCPTCGGEGR